MDDLEVPDELTGRRPQGHNGVRELVAAQALAAVEIGGRAARRDQDQVARRVSGERGPGVPSPGASRLLRPPGVPAGAVWTARHRLESPAQLTGPRVEAADIAFLHLDPPVVALRRPHDHHIA